MSGRRTRRFESGLAAVSLAVVWAALALPAAAAGPLTDYDVAVEIKNTTPEAKADWPVVMTVYKVFGRNLPAGTLNGDGYHVYDEKGAEIPHAIEAIPPLDQEGNNEIVFIVPKIDKGATLRYRITNTAKASGKRAKIDVVASRHNLIANAGFEAKGEGDAPAGWEADGRLDAKVKRSGGSSVRPESRL